MEYNFRKIEKKWQEYWKTNKVYQVPNESGKPKFYVLDMFPYPSGAGLHVGHPLGYIASDIYARFKRLKGFNVLHPMGYDAFGLPAEQYAIEHGIHPAVSTENNINNFRRQLDKIGFCYDWDREVKTCDPQYYKWTQWIFLQLFHSYFNRLTNKAESIDSLIHIFEQEGNINHPCPGDASIIFEKDLWKSFTDEYQQEVLMNYRLAYCGYGEVNWCEALGTVLANDEVVNGVSERGGHPVVKKKLRQWYLRITEYADRLLEGLERIDFSEAMKEMQTNWIGKSTGAEIKFDIKSTPSQLTVYTTRPDTIFGVDFMVVAPEHELVKGITTAEQKAEVEKYLSYVNSRSERERIAEKKISGCFTGAYAVNPFDGREIPIWISEYVLAGYGTGAIMAVPCGDERDFKFASHFGIPITNIIGSYYNGKEANPTKEALLENSGFLNGIKMKDAINIVIDKLEVMGIGKRKVNFKMRDAAFSRQRYWGEPFPIVWKNGVAYPLDESELPLELPKVDSYSPGPEGEGPLANIKEWVLIPYPSPQVEKGAKESTPEQPSLPEKETVGAANVPKYKVLTPMQYELAKNMRKNYTEAENKLWQQLRDNKLGVQIRRQHPIDAYIVDFVSLQNKLVIEVDGGYHETEEQKAYDANRTKVLQEIGFEVIRFTNEEVISNVYAVRDQIKKVLAKSVSSATNDLNKTENNFGVEQAPLSARGEGPGMRETNTMPGYAGSSWYFLRYMDPHNEKNFCDRKVSDYWNQVDIYIGGTEHAVGHLLYSRMWTKALYDLGHIGFDEPFKKLVNQGMITGVSQLIHRYQPGGNTDSLMISDEIPLTGIQLPNTIIEEAKGTKLFKDQGKAFEWFFSADSIPAGKENDFSLIHIPIQVVDNSNLDIEDLKQKDSRFSKAIFFSNDKIYVNGKWLNKIDFTQETGTIKFKTVSLGEKMSKSKLNTENPDDLVAKYGADTFRMYEMFLGPVEQSKPWDTKGIEGVHRFLKKLWRLFFDEAKGQTCLPAGRVWNEEAPTAAELKVLHKAIQKIESDTERFSFNTAVSAFMVCVNELSDLKCNKKAILEPVIIMLVPYAPHIAEELWNALGNTGSVLDAQFPLFEEKYVMESAKEYPVSINGKLRTNINITLEATQEEVEQLVLDNEVVKKWIGDKPVKKFIFIKNKMVNIVI